MASSEKTVMGSNEDGKPCGRKRKTEGVGKVKKPRNEKFYDNIRSGNTKVTGSSLNKRKPTLRNKARELQTLCGINVCMILVNPDGTIDKQTMWPEEEHDARKIIEEYLGTEAKYRVEEQLVNFFKAKLRKLEKKKVGYFVDLVSKRLKKLEGEELSREVDDVLEPMLKKLKNRAEVLKQNQKNEVDYLNYNDNDNNLDLVDTSEFDCDDLSYLLELDLPESYKLPPTATLSPQNRKSSPKDCKLSPQDCSFSPQEANFSTQYNRLSPQGCNFSPQDPRLPLETTMPVSYNQTAVALTPGITNASNATDNLGPIATVYLPNFELDDTSFHSTNTYGPNPNNSYDAFTSPETGYYAINSAVGVDHDLVPYNSSCDYMLDTSSKVDLVAVNVINHTTVPATEAVTTTDYRANFNIGNSSLWHCTNTYDPNLNTNSVGFASPMTEYNYVNGITGLCNNFNYTEGSSSKFDLGARNDMGADYIDEGDLCSIYIGSNYINYGDASVMQDGVWRQLH